VHASRSCKGTFPIRRESKALGSEEVKVLGCGHCYEQLSRGFAACDQNFVLKLEGLLKL
jgi:hypothetical protein